MRKNEDRKIAEQTFLKDRGRITNKDLAALLGVHPATVARWKKLDEWDLKLLQTVGSQEDAFSGEEELLYDADVRHLTLLNERLDAYLQKKELLASEILELAEAKYHIMNCKEIIHEHMGYPLMDRYDADEEGFD